MKFLDEINICFGTIFHFPYIKTETRDIKLIKLRITINFIISSSDLP